MTCRHKSVKDKCSFCNQLPFNEPVVTVMTPTCNRANWFKMAIFCIKNQTWLELGNKLEWVIVEDGEQDVRSQLTDLPEGVTVKYVRLDGKHPIGKKRNTCLDNATGNILIFHDDDDYYHPDHILLTASMLCNQRLYGVVGSSVLLAYSTKTESFYVCGNSGENHSPCGILAFTRRAMKQYELRFRDRDTHAEERYFLKDFLVPLLHVDPKSSIVAIQHGANTWNVTFDETTKINFSMPEEVFQIINSNKE